MGQLCPGAGGNCAKKTGRRTAGRPVLIVTAHLDEADDAIDQLLFFRPGCDARLYPAFEVLPGESNVSHELAAQRLELLVDLKGIGDRQGDKEMGKQEKTGREACRSLSWRRCSR